VATLSVQAITTSGIVPSRDAITSTGDVFSNNETEFVEVYNGSGSASVTVCFSAQKKCEYLSFHDISVVVGVGSTKNIGTFPVKWFNNGSDVVNITYSPSTLVGIEIGVFRVS
jgi:hypothetical protein